MKTSTFIKITFFFTIGTSLIILQPHGSYLVRNNSKISLSNLIINGFRSLPRPFYARVTARGFNEDETKSWFCSATIIDSYWALSTAHSMRNLQAENLDVQVGEFHREMSTRTIWTSPVEKIIISKGFRLMNNNIPIEDLAMIKLKYPFDNEITIRICTDDEVRSSDILGSCGMGSTTTSRSSKSFPAVLMESYFMEARYSGYDHGNFKPEQCPPSMICADAAFEGSNVCFMDAGAPLYVLECGFPRPKCLYGVTSFSTSYPKDENEDIWCNGMSIFVNVLYFRDAIMRQINN